MLRFAVLLRCLFLALCAGAVLAPAAGASVYGTQGILGGPGTLGSRLDAAKRAGAGVVRVPAEWFALEPRAQGERDPAQLAGLDEVVNAVAARGMKVVLTLSSTPCWASSAPDRGDCSQADANRFEVIRYRPASSQSAVPIATFLAARYADKLAAFQIWNEPDQANERYWAGTDKAQTYTDLVRTLYGPLKQAAPRVPVLAGSFVGKDGRWLKAMYAAGIKGYYDGLAVQFYGATLYGLRATRATQRFNGDSKPLWLTEYGFTDCYRRGAPAVQIDQRCVSPGAAAQASADVVAAARKRPWVAATIQFALYDEAPGGYTFGLFTTGQRIKPSYTAIRRVLTGKVKTPRRPTVRFRSTRKGIVVSGTASVAERVNLRIEKSGQIRLRATLLPDATGRFSLTLPRVLGRHGLRALAYAGYTGTRSARRR